MNTIIFVAVFAALVYSDVAFAQVGETVKKFTRSKIVKDFAFVLDSTLDTGPFSTTPGQEKRIYKSKDNRYTIEVIADKEGKNVILEKLSYPLSESQDPNDERCVTEFVSAATNDLVNKEDFLRLYKEIRHSQGKKLELIEGGFIVSVAVYHHALYKEMNITVTK
jgi:hypothetical protein